MKDASAKWEKEQLANDKGSSETIIAGHGSQIRCAVTAVNAIADCANPDQVLEGSVWGHASESGPGQLGISLKY